MNDRSTPAKRFSFTFGLLTLAVVTAAVQIVQIRRHVPGPHTWPLIADAVVAAYAIIALLRSRVRVR